MPRINGKIRAREVRVIGPDGKQVGILSLNQALAMARAHGVDLVEVAPNANPPVCRLVDYGKYRYELAKKEKESRKHQHASQVKEIQLSPRIDPHDLKIKIGHAIDFLCDDIKVKVALKFRGREMAHTEFGFDVVKKFLEAIAPYGHPDFEPKLVGRGIHVMVSPLPRAKRAKNPRELEREVAAQTPPPVLPPSAIPPPQPAQVPASGQPAAEPQAERTFGNNPFANLNLPNASAPVETQEK